IEVRAIKIAQRVPVLGKMPRHPVEQHANAELVHMIDKILEILWRAEATGWRVIPRYLVAPRTIEWKLHDGQQLNMCKTQLLHIRAKGVRQFAIGQKAILLHCPLNMALWHMFPRTQMDLIDRHRRVKSLALLTRTHPLLIAPGVLMNIR